MKRLSFVLALIFALVVGLSPAQAAYFTNSDSPSLSTEVSGDAFVNGKTVSVTAPVVGELFVAGNIINITKQATRSIFAAGNTVNVDQGAGYNAYVAGSTVTLSGEFGHDVYVAGSSVIIKDGTVIKGDLRVAGATLTIGGTIDGSVYAAGGDINFTGGKIGKDLIYHSDRDATNLDKITVGGKTEHKELDDRSTQASGIGAFVGAALVATWFYKLLAALVLGALIIFFLPKKVGEMSEIITNDWSRALGFGALGLIAAPVAAFVLIATVIGWKIGMAILLFYGAWILIVPIYGVFLAGSWILGHFGDKEPSLWASLLVGTVILSVLGIIPFIGLPLKIAFFVILTLPALGASIMWAKKHLS